MSQLLEFLNPYIQDNTLVFAAISVGLSLFVFIGLFLARELASWFVKTRSLTREIRGLRKDIQALRLQVADLKVAQAPNQPSSTHSKKTETPVLQGEPNQSFPLDH